MAKDLRPVPGRRQGRREGQEAQAREQYFLFRSTVEQGLNSLYVAESKLRYMMGLAATDGRLIRPATSRPSPRWRSTGRRSTAEALCRSVEIRRAALAGQAAARWN